eukprot:c12041_g1_i1.p1 GENE.c12041_g1_i1~~c12041_g1_i1.p1  ORF type:complete len:1414 (+),score=363.96 c12041_g1_i1:42-4244(+)
MSSKELAPENDAPRKITEIQFGMPSSHDICRASHLNVVNQEMFVLPERSPFPHGVLDPRLGVSRGDAQCTTCGQSLDLCAGHFGHVKLELPVFHIGYFKAIVNVCQSICKNCCKVLLAGKDRTSVLARMRTKGDGIARKDIAYNVILKCRKVRACPHCDFVNGTVKKTGPFRIVHERYAKCKPTDPQLVDFKQSFEQAIVHNKDITQLLGRCQDDLTPIRVQKMFENIPPEDCELLDMDPVHGRPERMIVNYVVVPPVCIRPSVVMNKGSNEDYLTTKLTEIIRVNNTLRAAMEKGAAVGIVFENYDFLQLQTALLINSDISGLPFAMQSVAKEGRSLIQRLKGKKGRFRGNLSGKRVDFTGRTVISPDPNLRIDQVAVPVAMARKLTYPERVNKHNIQRLRVSVFNGPDVHPGANQVIMGSDPLKLPKFLKHVDRRAVSQKLREGDIVERHMIDDDVVLFNRQPSLHKLSIMSHNAKIMPWHTLRFNECVCAPYNADFDGDEMNLHLPQTEEARAEANVLMGVVNNLVTPRNGDIIIAATQDFLTAAWVLTRKNAFFDRAMFTQLCAFVFDGARKVTLPTPALLKPMEMWTGKQVFNTLLMPHPDRKYMISLEQSGRNYSSGKIMCKNDGYIVIRNSELMCGSLDKKLLGEGKNSVFAVLMREVSNAHSAVCMSRLAKLSARFLMNEGFSIGIDDVTPVQKLQEEKAKLLTEGYRVCDEYIHQWKCGKLESQPGCNLDQTLEALLNKTLGNIREDAGKICIRELHWRNAPLNMALCGSKGSALNISQMIACVGQQTVNGARIPDGFVERTLPHFRKKERSPAAKGFVSNSFYSGLSPTEFFFHTMGGREGLVDTAVKTAETGYMQRRLMKTLEDLSVQYDMTVRNSEKVVVQFSYGDDQRDPACMEGILDPSSKTGVGGSAVDFNRNLLHVKALESNSAEPRMSSTEMGEEMDRLFQEAEAKTSKHFIAMARKFLDGIQSTLEKSETDLAKHIATTQNPSEHAGLWLRSDQLTRPQLRLFVTMCVSKYQRAAMEPGTAVGALAAQSIGEPCTQMTLKTFHFAGVASMNITLGVPRIKEIINASKNISTPIITAALDVENDVTVARIIKGRIETTKLGDICSYIREVYDNAQCHIEVQLDLTTIAKLQLDVDTESVKRAIHRSKLKLKPENVLTNGVDKIKVIPVIKTREKLLFELHALRSALPTVVVAGIPSVDRAVIHKKKDNVSYELLVEGSNLLRVMATMGVDGRRTTSNHIIEVEKTLGIEAARRTIINEIGYTVGAYGIHIDSRHVMLLADVMTCRGAILGITRFGIGKMKESVLMLASFEKTTDHLFDAAVHGRNDKIVGVSECIIMGIPISLGTGCFKLIHKLHKVTPPKTAPLLMHSTETQWQPPKHSKHT